MVTCGRHCRLDLYSHISNLFKLWNEMNLSNLYRKTQATQLKCTGTVLWFIGKAKGKISFMPYLLISTHQARNVSVAFFHFKWKWNFVSLIYGWNICWCFMLWSDVHNIILNVIEKEPIIIVRFQFNFFFREQTIFYWTKIFCFSFGCRNGNSLNYWIYAKCVNFINNKL